MKITAKQRKELNKIACKYSCWHSDIFIMQKFYEEMEAIGVEIPCWSNWDELKAHPYTWNGDEVENSLFVLQVYRPDITNRIEINMYFS